MSNTPYRLSLIVTIVLGLLIAIGCGETESASPGKAAAPTAGSPDAQFHRIDANDDGVVTNDEYEAFWVEAFEVMDADGNGKVTAEEFHAVMLKRHDAQDANDDGHVAKDEILIAVVGEEIDVEAAEPHATLDKSHFARMDANGDGKISPDEYAAEAAMWIAVADKNKDGKRSDDEMKARMAWLFEKIDANDDGTLDKAEVVEFYAGE